jgi:hypothetical protein
MAGQSYNPITCKWHEDEIKRNKEAIYGNGKEGLIAQVSSIKTKLDILIAMVSALLVGMLGMLFHIFK